MGKVVKKITKPITKAIGLDPDAADRAGREQANAIREQTARDTQMMQDQQVAAQRNLEASIAQQKAAQDATLNLAGNTPETPDVSVADPTTGGAEDPKRRRNPRDQFMSRGGGSGIRIT